MGTRRKAREMALQSLYQSEMSGLAPQLAWEIFNRHFDRQKRAVPYATELVDGVAARKAEIDALIERHSANWRLDRMSAVDRAILRIATYEISFTRTVPPSVAINEAIEISRRFSTDEAGAFINGILDGICRAAGQATENDNKNVE